MNDFDDVLDYLIVTGELDEMISSDKKKQENKDDNEDEDEE